MEIKGSAMKETCPAGMALREWSFIIYKGGGLGGGGGKNDVVVF